MANASLAHGFFFDSQDGDRVYDASSFEYWLKKFFTTGVFEGDLQVLADTGMNINVQTGYTNVDGKVRFFDQTTPMTIAVSDPSFDRIDNVVIERNDTDREITLKIVTGGTSTNPVAPEPTRADGVYQLVLAHIYVTAGATAITQADITDTRTDTSICGVVTGTVEEYDFDQFKIQFESFLENYRNSVAADYAEYVNQITVDYADYVNRITTFEGNAQTDFDTWFAQMKDQLSADAAGALQNEIDQHEIIQWLTVGVPDGEKSFSEDGLTITTTASDSRKVVKEISEDGLTIKTTLFSASGLEVANAVKTFSEDGLTINTVITILS